MYPQYPGNAPAMGMTDLRQGYQQQQQPQQMQSMQQMAPPQPQLSGGMLLGDQAVQYVQNALNNSVRNFQMSPDQVLQAYFNWVSSRPDSFSELVNTALDDLAVNYPQNIQYGLDIWVRDAIFNHVAATVLRFGPGLLNGHPQLAEYNQRGQAFFQMQNSNKARLAQIAHQQRPASTGFQAGATAMPNSVPGIPSQMADKSYMQAALNRPVPAAVQAPVAAPSQKPFFQGTSAAPAPVVGGESLPKLVVRPVSIRAPNTHVNAEKIHVATSQPESVKTGLTVGNQTPATPRAVPTYTEVAEVDDHEENWKPTPQQRHRTLLRENEVETYTRDRQGIVWQRIRPMTTEEEQQVDRSKHSLYATTINPDLTKGVTRVEALNRSLVEVTKVAESSAGLPPEARKSVLERSAARYFPLDIAGCENLRCAIQRSRVTHRAYNKEESYNTIFHADATITHNLATCGGHADVLDKLKEFADFPSLAEYMSVLLKGPHASVSLRDAVYQINAYLTKELNSFFRNELNVNNVSFNSFMADTPSSADDMQAAKLDNGLIEAYLNMQRDFIARHLNIKDANVEVIQAGEDIGTVDAETTVIELTVGVTIANFTLDEFEFKITSREPGMVASSQFPVVYNFCRSIMESADRMQQEDGARVYYAGNYIATADNHVLRIHRSAYDYNTYLISYFAKI